MSETLELILVNETTEHYRLCRKWFEDTNITQWLTSILRFGKYFPIIHSKIIKDIKNKLFLLKEDDDFVGLIGLFNIDKVDRRAEIFYIVGSKSNRNRGIAQRAVEILKKIAFDEYNLITIYANVAEKNVPSLRVLEKTGFKYVGRYRNAFNWKGEYLDLLTFDFVF